MEDGVPDEGFELFVGEEEGGVFSHGTENGCW